jgi:hypothetical protein
LVRFSHVPRADEDRALIDAIDLVTARLVAESQVNFEMLSELERLRDQLERELRARPLPSPDDVLGGRAL